jgi:hypothetical protein
MPQSAVSRSWRAFSGSVIARHYRRHRHQEFLKFLKLIDAAVLCHGHREEPGGPGQRKCRLAMGTGWTVAACGCTFSGENIPEDVLNALGL